MPLPVPPWWSSRHRLTATAIPASSANSTSDPNTRPSWKHQGLAIMAEEFSNGFSWLDQLAVGRQVTEPVLQHDWCPRPRPD